MPYTGLPGEEGISAATHLKLFHESYGEAANPRDLYRLQHIWMRFAPIWPRITFLLESLVDILWDFDNSLSRFLNLYARLTDDHSANMSFNRPLDPFDYFEHISINEDHVNRLILLRRELRKRQTDPDLFYYRQHARALLQEGRDPERKSIVDELLSADIAEIVSEVPAERYSGFWNVRRRIASRERTMNAELKGLQDDLEKTDSQLRPGSQTTTRSEPSTRRDIEYGEGPITPTIPSNTGADPPDERQHSKGPRVAFSPTRSPSPPAGRRGRHAPALDHDHSPWEGRRSMSRDSMFSHGASSIVTWAPAEPDAFSISMKVFSPSRNDWVESIAIMDTGCEGGNFISSSFLQEALDMGAEIESDPEGEAMQFVDFAGKTDFKPMGKVKLKWYGREIKSGRRGTRTLESEDWFRVAPHLTTEDGEKPFQILLGKDWLHDNEVLTYRGLRLFKSKEKKSASKSNSTLLSPYTSHRIHIPSQKSVSLLTNALPLETDPSHHAEQQRRQQLREKYELERLSERLASDAASISTTGTGTTSGGHSPPPSSTSRPRSNAHHSPQASTHSLSSSTTTRTGSPPPQQQTNGVGHSADANAVLTGGI